VSAYPPLGADGAAPADWPPPPSGPAADAGVVSCRALVRFLAALFGRHARFLELTKTLQRTSAWGIG